MPESRLDRAFRDYHSAVSPTTELPELSENPIDAFIELVDLTSHERGAFHLLDAGSDPYPGLAVGDRSYPWRMIWALQLAELEPFAIDSLPEITFYLDTIADPSGEHRAYSYEEGAPGPYEFDSLPSLLTFMSARVKHARGELDEAKLELIEAESSTLLEDEYEQSASSAFFVFENILGAPLPEAWEALSRGEWPEIELLGQPVRIDKSRPSYQRELSLRTLGLFLRDRRVTLPEGVELRELGAPHRRLIEHLRMLEESFELGLLPELIENLAAEGAEHLRALAQVWMTRFEQAHGIPDLAELEGAFGGAEPERPPAKEKTPLPDSAVDRLAAMLRGMDSDLPPLDDPELDDPETDDLELDEDTQESDDGADDEAPALTPFMEKMREAALEAIQSLRERSLIDVVEGEEPQLALDMANAAAEARSPKQMIEMMTRELVDSDHIDEVYATDDEIAEAIQSLMGG